MDLLALLARLGVTAGEGSDNRLVRAAAEDDGQAFGRLVGRHQGVVRAMLRRLVGDPALADDLAQTAFVKAWQKRHTFNPGNFRAWLCTLAYHVGIAHLRKRQLDTTTDSAAIEESDAARAEAAPDDFSATMDLGRAIDTLPAEQKRGIVLSFQAGLSHAEIATATGWPVGTVKSHIARAKRRLQQLLEGYDDHD